jgi:hypothetical protein
LATSSDATKSSTKSHHPLSFANAVAAAVVAAGGTIPLAALPLSSSFDLEEAAAAATVESALATDDPFDDVPDGITKKSTAV